MEGLLSPMRTKVRGADLSPSLSLSLVILLGGTEKAAEEPGASARTGGSLSFCLVSELGW